MGSEEAVKWSVPMLNATGRGQGRKTLDVALLRLRTIIGDVDILRWRYIVPVV
jgi:hypothetical protein